MSCVTVERTVELTVHWRQVPHSAVLCSKDSMNFPYIDDWSSVKCQKEDYSILADVSVFLALDILRSNSVGHANLTNAREKLRAWRREKHKDHRRILVEEQCQVHISSLGGKKGRKELTTDDADFHRFKKGGGTFLSPLK